MKTKIVLWGVTEKEEKVLVAIELLEAENLVKTYLIDEKDATEIFYNRMLNEWRYNTDIEFPEGTQVHEKQLTLSEDILPEGIKVDRPDLIIRAKTEWHFVVLSKKLYDLYHSELEDFQERINNLSDFDSGIWEELKGFWSKVQEQIREKNLFRNHIDSLRKQTDETFRQLKELKKKAEKELREESKKHYATFSEILEKVEEKIEGGLGLQPIFEELKDIQEKFKHTSFSREHRRQLWDRIDKAFKKIKEKRYGDSSEDRSPMARLKRRYDGLIAAIEKMERSIARDKRDLEQHDKNKSSNLGQLEMEIRKVKMSMVEERVQSKQEKLQDMLKTKAMLEDRMQNETAKEEKRKQFEDAKKEAKQKIAQEIKERSEEIEKNEDDLLKAAEKISEEKEEEKKGILEKVGEKLEKVVEEASEVAEDIVTTVKATAEVLEDKIEEKMEKAEEKFEKVEDKVEEKTEGMREKIKDVAEKVGEKLEAIEDKVEEKTEGLREKMEDVMEKVEDKVEATVDKIKEKAEEMMGKDEEE